MHDEIADRRARQVQRQRPPVVAVVERHVDLALGAGEQQPARLRILAHDVDGRVGREAARDQRPALAAVARPVDQGRQIVDAEARHREVGGRRAEMRRVNLGDLAPRGQRLRRDVGPRRAAVPRDVHRAVVRSGPDGIDAQRRRPDRVDDAAVLGPRGVGGVDAERGRDLPRRARQVGADRRPAPAAVDCLVEKLRREQQHARIGGGEQDRRGADEAVRAVADDDRADVLHVAAALVVARHLAAEDDPRMQRIGRRVAVLLDADRVPFAKGDRAVVAARRDAGRSAFLLPAVEPVGKAVVGGDVKHLRGRLVVPAAPGLSAVDRDRRALIGGDQDDVVVRRVDPDRVVVVAARRALDRGERVAAVDRTIRRGVRRVDDVGVGRVDAHVAEVVAAPPHARLRVDQRPGRAGIVRSVETGGARGDPRVNPLRIGRRDADPYPAQAVSRGRKALGQRLPRRPAVGGLEEAAGRAGVRVVVLPGRLSRRPQHRVHRLRVRRIEREVDRAGVLVLVEHLLERDAAVGGAEHAALLVRSVRMAERRDEQARRILRVDDDRADLARVPQAEVVPRPAGVARAIDPVADREIGALQPFAAADVDDVRIRRRDRDRADRLRRLAVEDRRPRQPVVGALPDAAVVDADVEQVRLLRHAGRADGAPAAIRADRSPAHRVVQPRPGLLGARRPRGEGEHECEKNLHSQLLCAVPARR